jgi:hypothetical protein
MDNPFKHLLAPLGNENSESKPPQVSAQTQNGKPPSSPKHSSTKPSAGLPLFKFPESAGQIPLWGPITNPGSEAAKTKPHDGENVPTILSGGLFRSTGGFGGSTLKATSTKKSGGETFGKLDPSLPGSISTAWKNIFESTADNASNRPSSLSVGSGGGSGSNVASDSKSVLSSQRPLPALFKTADSVK